jgi:hypothetical protein
MYKIVYTQVYVSDQTPVCRPVGLLPYTTFISVLSGLVRVLDIPICGPYWVTQDYPGVIAFSHAAKHGVRCDRAHDPGSWLAWPTWKVYAT